MTVDAPLPAAEPPDADPAAAAPAGVAVLAEPTVAAAAGPGGQPARAAFPEPAPLTSHGPATVVAMCNQKGGVGKTTTTINLGAALAELGRRVLLVDFDPQGALSAGLRVAATDNELTVHDALFSADVAPGQVVQRTQLAGLDVLPSNIDLAAAEVQLVSEVGREQALGRVLRPLVGDYDVVLVDCQPSLGLLTINALSAADAVIVPLECEYFAMRGVRQLFDTIEMVRTRINPRLRVAGILATMFDGRTLHAREVVASISGGAHGHLLFQTVINRTVKFPDSTVAREPITSFAPGSAGATAYRELAREVVARDIVR